MQTDYENRFAKWGGPAKAASTNYREQQATNVNHEQMSDVACNLEWWANNLKRN